MFNWSTLTTFAAALLFWLLAAYVLTRSPRSLSSLAAVVAVGSTAAYLLGQAMEANAPGPAEWRSWALGLRWGAPVAPAAWYMLTLLLLHEQSAGPARRYLRGVGYPLGVLIAIGGLVMTAAIYVDDLLWVWSEGPYLVQEEGSSVRYFVPTGPLYRACILYILVAALGSLVNLGLAWWLSSREGRHRRFAWLLVSALLFIPQVGSVTTYHFYGRALPTWFNHLALATAMAVMAANVTAYQHLRHGQTIRLDLLYFLTRWTLLYVPFTMLFFLAGGGYSFRVLVLLVFTLFAAAVVHVVAEPVRRLLDRLFFGREVQLLRSQLSTVVQGAALTRDENLGALLSQAQANLAEVSREHFVRLTEEALRRLNNPAALAECGLIERLPRTLAAVCAQGRDGELPGQVREATPLAQARAVREVLAEAIERLKPPDGVPEALQFHILREEYLLGRPNRQIMTRHSISEGTFHRNRRRAIAVLAVELARQEAQLPIGRD